MDGKPGSVGDLKVGQFVSVYYQTGGSGNQAVGVLASTPKPKPTPPTPHTGGTGDGNTGGETSGNGNTSTGGVGNKPPTPPTPKPIVLKPQVVQGVVSAACDGSVFQITKADGTVLPFAVDTKTQFRKSEKPAACSDVSVGQHVYVVFTPGSTNTALYAVVVVPPTNNGEHGSGGGAGTPPTGDTK